MKKTAFTLVEMLFVIVIIGILSTVGSEMFIKMFNSYTQSQAQNNIKSKTQLAMDKIVARLEYRVKNSVILSENATTIKTVGSTTTAPIFALEWVGKDRDSLRGMANSQDDTFIQPAISGFIDVQSSNKNSLHTRGGNLSNAAAIIDDLSYGDINFSSCNDGNNSAVIIFPNEAGTPNDYGWYGVNDPVLAHHVCRQDDTHFTYPVATRDFSSTTGTEVFEHYDFSFSAYALELNTNTNKLTLYYNYQPWNHEKYTNGDSAVLLDNVSTFRFLQKGDLLQVQLCVSTNAEYSNNLGNDATYAYCKEKAIF